MSERITWLLPVKNGMPYLTETLASIEAQTYRDWEVLAWDNGSTDGTLEELRRWIPARLPGRVIHDQPLSLGGSLARLVEVAETELCARIDADDVNYPERLTLQVAFLLEHPQVGMVGTQIEFIDERGSTYSGAWKQPCDNAEIRWQLRWACPFSHPTVMFRRSVIIAAGNYIDIVPEDLDLWMRVGRISETANMPDVLLKYRRSSTSFSATLTETSGKTSAHWLFDIIAQKYAAFLFNGMDGDAALEFRRKLMQGSKEEVKLSDLRSLHKTATVMALAAGKPPSYFRSTKLYRQQQTDILGRWLRQNAWVQAFLVARRGLRSYLRGSM